MEQKYKECHLCHQILPLTPQYFSLKFKGSEVYNSGCIKCRSAARAVQKQVNREKTLAQARAYGQTYYYTHREQELERFRKYRERMRESPEYKSRNNVREQRRIAKKKKLPSSFTLEQWGWCKDVFGNRCAYCGCTDALTQDHFIPVSSGGAYSVNNIVPACQRCNSSKNNKPFNDWYACQEFYDKGKEQKIIAYLSAM